MNSIFILAAANSVAEKLSDRFFGFALLVALLWIFLIFLHMTVPYMSNRSVTVFTAVTCALETILLFLYSVIGGFADGFSHFSASIFPTLTVFGITLRMIGRSVEYNGNSILAEKWLACGKTFILIGLFGFLACILIVLARFSSV